MIPEFLYRVELTHNFNQTTIYTEKFPVIKETRDGYWFEMPYGKKKWVSKAGRNRYAHTDERSALRHFIRRKTYRNVCIRDEMERNDIGLRKAKELLKEEDDKQRKK